MEGEGEKVGLNAALQDVVDTSEPPAPAAEQPALPLDLPDDLLAVAAGIDMDKARPPRRGRGRPPGAKNRRTDAWAEFILSDHRSPLQVLADIYSMPVEELALRLDCDRIDALKLQINCAKELAPYIHQKMPVAVQVDQQGVVRLVMEGSPPPPLPQSQGGSGLAMPIVEGEYEPVQNQQLSDQSDNELDNKELDE